MPDWTWIIELPQYRYGMTLFGALAVLPALVSGNMLIHEAGRAWRGAGFSRWRMLAGNAGVLVASVAIMAAALWQWL